MDGRVLVVWHRDIAIFGLLCFSMQSYYVRIITDAELRMQVPSREIDFKRGGEEVNEECWGWVHYLYF